jgi:hypothetical protein
MTTKKEVIAIKGFANCVLRGESYLIIPISFRAKPSISGKFDKKLQK